EFCTHSNHYLLLFILLLPPPPSSTLFPYTTLFRSTYVNEPSTPFKELFYNVNLYTVLIIGAPLYGVVTTYLFNREYVENTIKNILTIPVSRVSFIMSKTLLLFMWIMMLTM